MDVGTVLAHSLVLTKIEDSKLPPTIVAMQAAREV